MEDDEENRKALGARFAAARDLLGLSRGQAAKPCSLLPRDIAQIEDGAKRFIPTPYLQFLSKAIDLNSLFDYTTPVRLRPPEAAIARIPAVEQILATNKHIQAVAGPPEWLKPMLELQADLQKRMAAIEAAQKGEAPRHRRKAG